VGDAAAGDGLRQRDDVLAALARLAAGGCLGTITPGAARPTRRGGGDRLVARQPGQRQRPGKKGGDQTGPNPTDRGKPGTKRHLVVDRWGIPLAVRMSGANRHDSQLLVTMVDAIPPIKGRRGRPRKRPKKLHADKAYDFRACRDALRKRHIVPRIARRGIESSERLGRYRWVAERTLAWLAQYRRLDVRYERRADIHQAFLDLGCALICWSHLS
jgi:transposase